jgi:hypothetical protein
MDTVARLKAHIPLSGCPVFRQSVCLRAKKKEKTTLILSPGDFKQTVDRVEALTVCHVFSVASRPVAGDFATRVKGAQQPERSTLEEYGQQTELRKVFYLTTLSVAKLRQ